MHTMIMKDGHRLVIFNDPARACLSIANEAIRKLRNRAGLLPVDAVHIDGARPLVVLRGTPPEMLLDAASGLSSRKLADDSYQARCTAFDVDWQWTSRLPAAHASRLDTPRRTLPDNVVAHPFFGGPALKTVGDAS